MMNPKLHTKTCF